MTYSDDAPSRVREAISRYDAAVRAALPEARDAWSRPRPFKEVLALHARLGDAAEALCRECRLLDDSYSSSESSWAEARRARAWVGKVLRRHPDEVVLQTRAEQVSLAIDLWFVTYGQGRPRSRSPWSSDPTEAWTSDDGGEV